MCELSRRKFQTRINSRNDEDSDKSIRRKPQPTGNSWSVTLPKLWLLAEAVKRGYSSIAKFLIDYELEFIGHIPKGGGFFDGEVRVGFVRRRNR